MYRRKINCRPISLLTRVMAYSHIIRERDANAWLKIFLLQRMYRPDILLPTCLSFLLPPNFRFFALSLKSLSIRHWRTVILVCSSRIRNSGSHKQGRNGLIGRHWKAHHTKHRWPPRERHPLSATLRFTSTLQCSRCLGYLHPHNSEDEV